MVAAAVLAIELVSMVNPDVRVVCIKRDAIVHATHDGKITELNTLRVAYEEAEALDGRIVTNSLKGHVHLRVGLTALDL